MACDASLTSVCGSGPSCRPATHLSPFLLTPSPFTERPASHPAGWNREPSPIGGRRVAGLLRPQGQRRGEHALHQPLRPGGAAGVVCLVLWVPTSLTLGSNFGMPSYRLPSTSLPESAYFLFSQRVRAYTLEIEAMRVFDCSQGGVSDDQSVDRFVHRQVTFSLSLIVSLSHFLFVALRCLSPFTMLCPAMRLKCNFPPAIRSRVRCRCRVPPHQRQHRDHPR